MGRTFTIKQDRFEHGMQGDVRDKNLVGSTQVFGASKLKNFDIYKSNTLTPVPSITRFNTDTEKEFGIGVIGGTTNLYGLGVSIDNWYGSQWTYRIRLTTALSSAVDHVVLDLSNLTDNFWDNVNESGSDIRVTETDNNESIPYRIVDFDRTAKTGSLIIADNQLKDIDLYFGNTAASTPLDATSYSNLRDFFPFEDPINYGSRSFNLNDGNTFVPVDALYGSGVSDEQIRTTSGGGATSGEQTTSFLVNLSTLPIINQKIIFDDFSIFEISILTTGAVRFSYSNSNFITIDSSTTLSLNTWHYVTCVYDSGTSEGRIYIDGVEVGVSSVGSGGLDSDPAARLFVEPSSEITIDMLTTVAQDKNATRISQESQMLLNNGSVWTEGSLENVSGITFTYSGLQVYIRENDSWIEFEVDGIIARNLDLDPVYSYIQDDSTTRVSFLFSDDISISNPRVYGGIYDGGIAGTESAIELGRVGFDANPVRILGADREDYISVGDELESYNGTNFTDGVFLSGTNITSLTNYGISVALTGNRRDGRGSIEIWDLITDDPRTVIDTGVGEQRVIANVQGSLIVVSNNFIEDSVRSFNRPSLDFREWISRDRFNTLQSFEYPNHTPTIADPRGNIVNNNRVDLRGVSMFYAEPSLEDAGMWAIGVNDLNNQIGVSIFISDAMNVRFTNYFTYGNNIILIDESFGHWIINSDNMFTSMSVFESMVIDGGLPDLEKKLNKFEITLNKPLPIGQTISTFYRINSNATWTRIFDLTQEETRTFFGNQDFNGNPFDDFNEIEFRIESMGGDAQVVEWVAEVEVNEEE